jgi:hypothetical protein
MNELKNSHYLFVDCHRWDRCSFVGLSTSTGQSETTRASRRSIWTDSLSGCCLETWLLAASKRGVVLGTRSLGKSSKA